MDFPNKLFRAQSPKSDLLEYVLKARNQIFEALKITTLIFGREVSMKRIFARGIAILFGMASSLAITTSAFASDGLDFEYSAWDAVARGALFC